MTKKKFEKNNPTVALNVLYVISCLHFKQHHFFNKFKRRRMVLSWTKKLFSLLRGVTSKRIGIFLFKLS